MKKGVVAREVSSYQNPFGFSPDRSIEPMDSGEGDFVDNYEDEEGGFSNEEPEVIPDNPPVEHVEAQEDEPEDNEEGTGYERGSFEEEEDGIDEGSLVPTLLSTFKSLGVVGDDFDLPEDARVADLFLEIDKARAEQVAKMVREEYENTYSPDLLQYVDFLIRGGDPQAVSDHYAIMNLPIEDKDGHRENREALIMAMYADKGIPEKKAQALYQKSYEDGDDIQDAQEAKAYFDQKHQARLSQIEEANKQAAQQAELEKKQAVENLRKTLRSGKIGEVELKPTEVTELDKYMFDQSVVVEVPDPNTGKTYKAKVSQYYVDYNRFFESPDSIIRLARFIKSNGAVDMVKSKAREELSNDLLMALSGVSKQKKGRNGKQNAFFN